MSQLVRASVRPIALITLALVAQAGWAAPAIAAAPVSRGPDTAGLRPTIHYEEARAHAHDRIAFAPGGRVTVGFAPRAGDSWKVGGVSPRALPAGRLDGRQLRERDKPAPAKREPSPAPSEAHRWPRPQRPQRHPPSPRPCPMTSINRRPTRPRSSTRKRCPGRRRPRMPHRRRAPPSARAGSSARSSASCPTGSSATARRRWTSRRSRRLPTSASASTRRATSRSGTATGRRPSAGAAGRARR